MFVLLFSSFLDPLLVGSGPPFEEFPSICTTICEGWLHSSELNLKRFSLWGNVFPIFFFFIYYTSNIIYINTPNGIIYKNVREYLSKRYF